LRETISAAMQLPTVEIDSLFHGANWTKRPSFESEVDEFTAAPAWVIEWQYRSVKPLLLSRADVLIWLDHGRWTVLQRVVRRTLRRRIRRIELWNGNYEPPLWTIFTDPENIIRWALSTHRARAEEAFAVAKQTVGPNVVRLAGQVEVDAWVSGPLRTLAAAPGESW